MELYFTKRAFRALGMNLFAHSHNKTKKTLANDEEKCVITLGENSNSPNKCPLIKCLILNGELLIFNLSFHEAVFMSGYLCKFAKSFSSNARNRNYSLNT